MPGVRAPRADEDSRVADDPRGDGARGGETLLNIPLPTIAGESLLEHPSLNRLAMSDITVDIERRRGIRPSDDPVYTTGTIEEEARQADSEERAAQLRGTDFYLPLAGQPCISQMRSWRGPVVTEQGNPGIYVQIDESVPLYKGNVYVVDEVTGRMYLSNKSHLMRIPETASHRPLEDHELSISRHIPERETDVVPRMGGEKELQYPEEPVRGQESRPGEEIGRAPDSVVGITPRAVPGAQHLEDTVTEDTVISRHPAPERELQQLQREQEEGGKDPSFSLPPPGLAFNTPKAAKTSGASK